LSPFSSIFDVSKYVNAIVWAGRNFRVVLLAIGFLWLLYLGSILVGLGRQISTLKDLITALDGLGLWINIVVPIVCFVLAGFAIYWPRKPIWDKFIQAIRTPLIEGIEIYPELISNRTLQIRLNDWSRDADELKILAGDADFLDKDPPQLEEIESHLKQAHLCQMLIKQEYKVKVETLKKLIDGGLEVRVYPDDGDNTDTKLRGRLKRDAVGRLAWLYDRRQDQFKVNEFINLALVEMVNARFDDWFERGSIMDP